MSLETCPNCGADLPRNAKACPECGSDENTGWSDEAYASGLDLPDDEFDYEKFVEKEFGEKRKIKPQGIHWLWWIVGLGLIVLFLFAWLRF